MSHQRSQVSIESEFAGRGCKLIDTYKNRRTRLKFVCRCGKEGTISYASFQAGSYCLGCSGKKKYTTEEIRQCVVDRGCELLSEYKNALAKIVVKCQCGNVYETRWNQLQQGSSCKKCGYQKAAQSRRQDSNEVAAKFKAEGCQLLSEYKNNHQLLKYKCSCGRESSISFSNFNNGHRCKLCRSENMSGDKHPNWEPDRAYAKLKINVAHRCSSLLRYCLKRLNKKKYDKTSKILGYTRKQLLKHLMAHPNWLAVKDGVWHIDHIYPVKAFLQHGIHDLSLINCLENLRPLGSTENLKKSGKYDVIEFQQWLTSRKV